MKLDEVYVSNNRFVLEYACPALNPGLTKQHIHDIERVHKRAMLIIKPAISNR